MANLENIYSNKVAIRMNNPTYSGEITQLDALSRGHELVVADIGGESLGSQIRFYWELDPKSDIIVDAKFKAFGGAVIIAISDFIIENCIGKTVFQAVKTTNIDVEFSLRDTPDIVAFDRMDLAVMGYEITKKCASLYLDVDVNNFENEPIVCKCAYISLRTLKEVIKLNNLKTVAEIGQYTKAGTFCKSCIQTGGKEKRDYYLVDILAEVRKEMDEEKMLIASKVDGDFETMTLVQQMKAVDAIIDENVRQFLIMDGGNMEVIDIKVSEEYVDIYIRYLGACNGCASSATGTLYAIEATLKEKLSSKIRVLPI